MPTTIWKKRSRAFKWFKVYQNRTIIKEVISEIVVGDVLAAPAPLAPSNTMHLALQHPTPTPPLTTSGTSDNMHPTPVPEVPDGAGSMSVSAGCMVLHGYMVLEVPHCARDARWYWMVLDGAWGAWTSPNTNLLITSLINGLPIVRARAGHCNIQHHPAPLAPPAPIWHRHLSSTYPAPVQHQCWINEAQMFFFCLRSPYSYM